MSVTGVPLSLDDAQRRVVEHVGGTLVYLGAPGSGTTTALAHAIAERTRTEGARSVWAVTVGRRAAADLRSQVAGLLGSGALPTITTIHALAFSLVSSFGPRLDEDLASLRVLSGAEEDQRARELILGSITDASIDWPDSVRQALPTLGMANEVRAFTTRLRDLGLDPDQAERAAEASGDPLVQALVHFASLEAETASLENVIDYSGLISLARAIASTDEVRLQMQSALSALYVDEFHDFDALQADLLMRLVPADKTFVVAGDPARSIYGFRGSDPRVFADLLERRRQSVGSGAPEVIVAPEVHRGSAQSLAIAARVLAHETLVGLPSQTAIRLRRPRDGAGADPDASVDIVIADASGNLRSHIGRLLREAHVRDGIPWSQMAVLTRTTSTVADVRRDLQVVGVPVHTESIDLALPDEPAVSALLDVMDAATRAGRIGETEAVDVMSGPVIDARAADLRALARGWRARLRRDRPDEVAPRFPTLLTETLNALSTGRAHRIPEELLDTPGARRLLDAGRLLASLAWSIDDGQPPAQVMWQAWSGALPDARGVAWPERLRRAALAGHRPSGHDIDAVLALFATAERLTERYRGVFGVEAFAGAIRDQRVPAEAISERGVGVPEAVSVLTAHHAKARSWHTVIVVDLQEGVWPRANPRNGLLDIDSLLQVVDSGRHGSPSQQQRDQPSLSAAALDADRRLLYTALTRARHRTVLAAVESRDEAGAQPSRFIDDVESGIPRVTRRYLAGRPARPLTLTGHIADLRTRLLEAEGTERTAIVDELAALALLRDDDGRPLAAAADPATWWNANPTTVNDEPIRPADQPLRLSASALQSVTTCPLRWFLDRQVHAAGPSGAAATLGRVVHALADAVATGDLPPDPQVLTLELDRVWPYLGFDVPWHEVAEHERVRVMLARLCRFHRSREDSADHEVVGTEIALDGRIDLHELARIVSVGRDEDEVTRIEAILEGLTGVDQQITVSGRIDRIDRDADGRLDLLDIKTGAKIPTEEAVVHDLQLALYQAALMSSALSVPLDIDDPRIAQAALVFVAEDAGQDSADPKTLIQPALTSPGEVSWFFETVRDAVTTMRASQFPPRSGDHCNSCDFTAICPTRPASQEVP